MNKIVRMPQQQVMPPPGAQQQSGWVWDGTQWNCGSDGSVPPFPCPGPGWPPPGCPPWYSTANSPPWYPGANAGVSFGTTPPPNPVRGHFWWDGQTLWMFDGAAWIATGGVSGGLTPPSNTPPANPAPGQQWFNGTTLYIWDGNAWVPASQTKTTISATAPPAPNPGDLWYNGTQLHIWDGSAWELVGPGAIVGPVPTTTIMFAMTATTSLTIASTPANWGIVPFNNQPLTDIMSAWNSVTHEFMPTKPGIYLFLCRMYASAGTGAGLALLKNDPGTFVNGTNTSDLIVCIGSESTSGWITVTGVVQLNGTTDYVRLWAWDGAGTFATAGGNPVYIGTLLP